MTTQIASDYDLQNALVRRGLGMDMGMLLKYSNHEKLNVRLMTAKTAEPPPGYRAVSIQQIRLADEKFFDVLADLTRKGIKRSTPEGSPLDTVFDQALNDMRFTMLLLPLPAAPGRQRSRTPRRVRKNQPGSSNQDPVGKGGKAKKGKGKGKGKGKNKDYKAPVPVELLPEGVSKTVDDEPICFSYNCKRGCRDAAAGGYCAKGKHVCCYKGCFKPHTFKQHKQALQDDIDGSDWE